MHPSPSVIIFTALSGLGFGLLVFLGLKMPDVTGVLAFIFFVIGFGLAVGGLISSTFHLGRPERSIKAFKQWRSSWLSREAIAAVFTLSVMAVYAIGRIFFDYDIRILGVAGAIMSIVTVFTTSMIYAQLKSIPRWNTKLTPAYFLSLSLAGGALLAGQIKFCLLLLLISGIIQLLVWIKGDRALALSGTTIESGTGLGTIGRVRAFEPPHTGTNYLLKEFVHIVGRKHSAKLRIIALILMIGTPILLLSLSFSYFLAALSVISHIAGLFISRWLFFAEAEHVVGLYYGKR
ncbi:MAG: dibenzothiophene desulfurase [Rhodobacteraceae bacterium]|nr:dibenzothiophene desulfurase [Paracoccaceae bacterium]|tara:strand:+ start:353 stop:1225 length:873 start_codon:yes stop_codon:yes gene_type:complete